MSTIHKCEKCNYETRDKSNYNRHLKSVAHLQVDSKVDTKLTLNVNSDRPSKLRFKMVH